MKGTKPMLFHSCESAERIFVCSSPGKVVSIALIFSITSRLSFRFSCSSLRCDDVAALRFSKNASQAPTKRFHKTSEYFCATGPTSFHSFCSFDSLSAVAFQSSLSFNASACSQSSFLRSRFFARTFFASLKNSLFCLKNSSQAARKRSKILRFIFCGAKPISFHFACRSRTCWVALFQA